MALKLLDYVNLGWIWTKSFLPTYHRWHGKVEQNDIRVSYGFDSLPAPDERASGGIIKVQDLSKTFPNQPTGANILYLVSSALPYFAVRMARLARRAGATIVLNQNGVAYPAWFGKGWKSHNRPLRQLVCLADHIFYQSQFCKLSADRYLSRPKCSWEILYNPVDTKTFCPPKDSRSPERKPRLLIAGSHQSYYRPRVALEVLKHVLRDYPAARLTIAGRFQWEKDEAKARSRLVNDIGRFGLSENVYISGAYNQIEAVNLFQKSDLLLHIKYNDPCPRLVVEAMACGLPVVFSATGGVPELVGKSCGIGVPGQRDWEKDHPPDAQLMADAALKVLSKREKYSAAARRQAVEKFDVTPWLRRHEEIFKRLRMQEN